MAGALAVDRGDHDLARDQLEAAAWCHQVGDGRLNGLLHRALAELAVWQGRHDDAALEVDAGLELLAHTGDPELAARIAAVGVRAEADRAEAARRTVGGAGGPARRGAAGDRAPDGQAAPPPRRTGRRRRGAGRRRRPRPRGAPHRAGRGRPAGGRAHPAAWGRAVDVWDAVSFRYLAAYCRFRRAEAALAAGDEAAAAGDLRRAWEATRALRAAPLGGAVERLARRAASTSARPVPAVPAAPEGGPALTPREGEVLALVAERAGPTARSARCSTSARRRRASTSPACWPSWAPAPRRGPRPRPPPGRPPRRRLRAMRGGDRPKVRAG